VLMYISGLSALCMLGGTSLLSLVAVFATYSIAQLPLGSINAQDKSHSVFDKFDMPFDTTRLDVHKKSSRVKVHVVSSQMVFELMWEQINIGRFVRNQ